MKLIQCGIGSSSAEDYSDKIVRCFSTTNGNGSNTTSWFSGNVYQDVLVFYNDGFEIRRATGWLNKTGIRWFAFAE